MCKGTKITSRVDSYKTTKRWVKKQSTGAGSSVAKFRNLRKFAGCEFSQSCKIFTELSFSSAFFLQISSGSIMHLRIRLGYIVLNRIEDNKAIDLQNY